VIQTALLGTRYNPSEVEERVKRYWEDERIYEKLKSRRSSKIFFFLDGPPYPSSPTFHPGTGWNKVIKDAVLRFYSLRGYDVTDTPGYDTHGLPIEYQIEKRLGISSKKEIIEKIGIDRFVQMCKEFVFSNVEALSKGFKDLGVMMDWSKPYMTLNNDYIEEAWKLVKAADEKGLLDTDVRVLHWCPRCETVLADYEVTQEYVDLEDPSIYVKMPVRGRNREYLVIWTTTPWTLPANTFIMARGDAIYVKVKVGDEILIMAEQAVERVMREAGIKEYQIVGKMLGRDLEGVEYDHPLEDIIPLQSILKNYHRVVIADRFVSLEEGTGLVHAAPGHGPEDFEVARNKGFPIYSPLDDSGRFTKEAGRYAGVGARDANKEIIEDLRSRGALLAYSKIVHRYPVCWRCKTPLLLRATKQWIIRTSALRSLAIEEASKVKWIPRWGLDRMKPLLESMQDWVISRQRFWGVPLPIWICRSCGYKIVIGSVREIKEYGGEEPEDLHRPWIDRVILRCPRCGGQAERVPDVADVWLDSGVAFYASLGRDGLEKFKSMGPVDFVVEGHDQTRGWFFSMLRSGLIVLGSSPYKTILVHGFVLDEKGREMHKSLGNYVEVSEVVRRYGRDAFRLFVLSNTTWEDLKFSMKRLEDSLRDLNIMWNVLLFSKSYMEIDGYGYSEEDLNRLSSHLRIEDKWVLSRLASVVEGVTRAMEEYRIHEAVNMLRDFIVEDLSRTYLKIVRRRVWEEENTPDKLAVYATLFRALKAWSIMASIAIPHMAELVYQELIRRFDSTSKESVNLEQWPDIDELSKYRDGRLEKIFERLKEVFEALASARMNAGIRLRRPVEMCIVASDSAEYLEAVERGSNVIKEMMNCQEVIAMRASEAMGKIIRVRARPILSSIGREFRDFARNVASYIEQRGEEVAREVSKGFVKAIIEGKEVVIRPEHVEIVEEPVEGHVVVKRGWGYAAITTKVSEELALAGLARELIRRIQVMRKELGLSLMDIINVDIYSEEDNLKAIERVKELIARETRSTSINIKRSQQEVRGALIREWEIDGEIYVIAISKL
jgi:isoleucyl-tRNA synthetase